MVMVTHHRRRSSDQGLMMPIGVVVSLMLSLASSVFSVGVLWQRVSNLETNMLALTSKTEKENGEISAILQKLSAIEVRLEPRFMPPVSSHRP